MRKVVAWFLSKLLLPRRPENPVERTADVIDEAIGPRQTNMPMRPAEVVELAQDKPDLAGR